MELTLQEQKAIQMLQTQPYDFEKVLTPERNIDIYKVLQWYERLLLSLELSRAKRKNEYTDVEKIEPKLEEPKLEEKKEESLPQEAPPSEQ